MQISDEVWTASAGETFDMIARNVYGDEQYTADILCANPKLCGILRFTGGETVRLPVVQLPEDSEASAFGAANAPWKG